MKIHLFALSALLCLVVGCSSRPKKPSTPGPQASIGIQPAVANYPQPPAPAVTGGTTEDYRPESVFKLPKLRKVYLEPYEDENGNAYGPQVMWKIEDKGGWNLEALRNPSKAYIPTSLAPEMEMPAAFVTQNTGETPVRQKTRSIRELYELDDVTVTGFVERGQEPLVAEMEAKMNGSHVRYYDEQLGWLLVPKAAFAKVHN